MAVYRYQVVCVGMWRGKIKRWNTTFHLSNSSSIGVLHSALQGIGYPNPGDTTGACSGGIASVSVYDSSGGTPISQVTYFDWQTPSEWIPYTGGVWSSLDPQPPVDASGESAVMILGELPGLSATGKPVFTRKYWHAIPSRTAVAYGDPDVPPAVASGIAAAISPNWMLSPSGIAPSAVTVDPWYGNHQRVRGRRRTTAQVAAQAFSFGVLAGGGATTSGQGEPFPGGEF